MKTIDEMTEDLVRQTCELMVAVRKLKETDYVSDVQNYENLTDRLEMLSEKYACNVRDFAIKTFTANRYEVLDKSTEMQGIEIRRDGNAVIIDLPQLLPRKKGKQHNFLCDPLRHKFEEISAVEDIKIREKAVICVIHIYDEKRINIRCYDYDNLESKKVLDIVSLFTLTDDSPQYCDVYQTVRFGKTDKTRIMVVPAEEFADRILSLMF